MISVGVVVVVLIFGNVFWNCVSCLLLLILIG